MAPTRLTRNSLESPSGVAGLWSVAGAASLAASLSALALDAASSTPGASAVMVSTAAGEVSDAAASGCVSSAPCWSLADHESRNPARRRSMPMLVLLPPARHLGGRAA
jgi:hypothetical protein